MIINLKNYKTINYKIINYKIIKLKLSNYKQFLKLDNFLRI